MCNLSCPVCGSTAYEPETYSCDDCQLPSEEIAAMGEWTQPRDCARCGEPLGDEDLAEVVDPADGEHYIVHAEPCSYECGWEIA